MTKCNGTYAETLTIRDRYYWCQGCTDCELSADLPEWHFNADPETDVWEGDELL